SEKQVNFLKHHQIKNIQDLVFINLHDYKAAANDVPITQRSMNLMLKNLCKKLEINSGNKQLSMYSFRHTVCTKLASTPEMSYRWATERMWPSLGMPMKSNDKAESEVNKQIIES